MRQRGLSTVPTLLLAACGGLAVTVVMMSWVVVEVDTPAGVHVKVPVPLVALRCAAGCVPMDDSEMPKLPPELTAHKEAVLTILDELESCPDATLVEVEAPDANVRVVKQGGEVLIDVDADDAVVHVAVPVRRMARVVRRWDWETVEPKLAFDLLAAGKGDLVTVHAEEASVRVAVW
jgi:hypothetical protein